MTAECGSAIAQVLGMLNETLPSDDDDEDSFWDEVANSEGREFRKSTPDGISCADMCTGAGYDRGPDE